MSHGVVLLDVSVPGTSGPGLQRELVFAWGRVPSIFLTAEAVSRSAGGLLSRGAGHACSSLLVNSSFGPPSLLPCGRPRIALNYFFVVLVWAVI